MKIKFIHIIFLLLIVTVIHFGSVLGGLYEGKVWVDIPLHFFSGMILGVFWLWIIQRTGYNITPDSSKKLLISISIIGFALIGSFLWEVFEFLFWKFLPNYSLPLKLYSSTVSDVLTDIFAGLIGGIVIAILAILPKKKRKKKK